MIDLITKPVRCFCGGKSKVHWSNVEDKTSGPIRCNLFCPKCGYWTPNVRWCSSVQAANEDWNESQKSRSLKSKFMSIVNRIKVNCRRK